MVADLIPLHAELRKSARLLHRFGRAHGSAVLACALESLSFTQLDQLSRCWHLAAHEAQLRPDDGRAIHLHVGGRGAGKSRGGAEDALDVLEDFGAMFRGQLVSKRFTDVQDVMIKGPSGLLACARRRGYELTYHRGDQAVRHPSGAEFKIFSAEQPEGPRGYECNYAWLDEIAAWQETKAIECFDNVLFSWRAKTPIGTQPLMRITTTPRPNPIMFRLLRERAFVDRIALTHSTTHENAANLSAETYATLVELYDGTSKGRQELMGELLDIAGALIDLDTVHRNRVKTAPDLSRIIVSVDPAVTSKRESDATGIVVVGKGYETPAHAYVLADRTVERAKWSAWGRRVVETFVTWGADAVVAEVNQGGEGIEEQIKTSAEAYSEEIGREIVVPVINVWAKQSKRARAEPIGALYERGRVRHVGVHAHLEKELASWVPGMPSPDRMDALVHGVWNLLLADLATLGPIARYGLADGLLDAA